MNLRSNHWLFQCPPVFQEESLPAPPPGYVREYVPFGLTVRMVVAALAKLNHQDRRVVFRADVTTWERLVHGRSSFDRQLQALAHNHQATLVRSSYPETDLAPPYPFRLTEPPGGTRADRFGVGSTAPRLWVLGERANPAARSFPLPFGTQAGTEMLWPEIRPGEVRVSNVLEPDETPDLARRRLPRDWVDLGRPPVLCVGRTSAALIRHLRDVRIVGAVDHVQYTWRFHHGEREEWTRQFAELVELSLAWGAA